MTRERANGRVPWRWLLFLSGLTLVVLVGSSVDLRQRMVRTVSLEDMHQAINVQTREIQELQTGGTRVSFQVLQELQRLQEQGSAVTQDNNERLQRIERQLGIAGPLK